MDQHLSPFQSWREALTCSPYVEYRAVDGFHIEVSMFPWEPREFDIPLSFASNRQSMISADKAKSMFWRTRLVGEAEREINKLARLRLGPMNHNPALAKSR